MSDLITAPRSFIVDFIESKALIPASVSFWDGTAFASDRTEDFCSKESNTESL